MNTSLNLNLSEGLQGAIKLTVENINKNPITPKEKIINSLQTAKIFNCGQKLRVLACVGFGSINDHTIKETQKILKKLDVYYSRHNKVWVLK